MSELKGLERALALATADLSGTLKNHVIGVSGRSSFDIPLGTTFGHWVTVSAPYPKKYETQYHTAIDVRCTCGIVLPRLVSSLRRGTSTRCQSCSRKAKANANR